MKKLRAFIQENKRQFDDQELPAGLWKGIEARLDQQIPSSSKPRSIWKRSLSIAASLLLLTAAGTWLYKTGKEQGQADYHRINPLLAAQWERYTEEVKQKRDSLQVVMAALPQEKTALPPFSSELDEQYQRLQQELKTSPNQATTLQALIDLLQLQLHYYTYQLQLIQQHTHPTNHEHNL